MAGGRSSKELSPRSESREARSFFGANAGRQSIPEIPVERQGTFFWGKCREARSLILCTGPGSFKWAASGGQLQVGSSMWAASSGQLQVGSFVILGSLIILGSLVILGGLVILGDFGRRAASSGGQLRQAGSFVIREVGSFVIRKVGSFVIRKVGSLLILKNLHSFYFPIIYKISK